MPIACNTRPKVCLAMEIRNAHSSRRHRFAIRTLLGWYREGADVEQQLPALSPYLGHTCVRDTYWYLSACPELMQEAAQRLDRRWEAKP
jgi:hypothetical protein